VLRVSCFHLLVSVECHSVEATEVLMNGHVAVGIGRGGRHRHAQRRGNHGERPAAVRVRQDGAAVRRSGGDA